MYKIISETEGRHTQDSQAGRQIKSIDRVREERKKDNKTECISSAIQEILLKPYKF